jgi:hypothetical protein
MAAQGACSKIHVRRTIPQGNDMMPNLEGENARLGWPAPWLLVCPSPKDGQRHSHFLNVTVKLPALAVIESPKVSGSFIIRSAD